MNIQFVEPLSRGFNRMKAALFQPFDLKKWFVIGFTAWLAGLMDSPNKSNYKMEDSGSFADILDAPYEALRWLQDNPQWTAAIIFVGAFILILIAGLTWLSSRGKFMFVDNIVHDRALVKQPWSEFAKEGDSLFVLRLIWAFISMGMVLSFLYSAWHKAYDLYYGPFDQTLPLGYLIRAGLLFILLLLFIGYINLIIDEFLVAVMYRQRVSALDAWAKLQTIHWPFILKFILFGLLWFALRAAVIAAVVVIGLMTCCVGFLPLIIPYINAVVLLPVSYTFRAFSLEFLAQFGDEFSVFSIEEPPATEAVG